MNEPHSFELFFSSASADRAWAQGYLIPALASTRTHHHARRFQPRRFARERNRARNKSSRYTILFLSPAYLAEQRVEFGVRAILNYAPITLTAPPNVRVDHIAPVAGLQSTAHYL